MIGQKAGEMNEQHDDVLLCIKWLLRWHVHTANFSETTWTQFLTTTHYYTRLSRFYS